MQHITLPIFIDAFLAPIRDQPIAQVAVVGVLLLILLDVVFGVVNACVHSEYSSGKMRGGLGHKCAELGLMLVGIIADGMLVGGFDLGVAPVFPTVCAGLAIMELGSILEIIAELNPDIAKLPVFRLLASTKHRDETAEEGEN